MGLNLALKALLFHQSEKVHNHPIVTDIAFKTKMDGDRRGSLGKNLI